MKTEFLVDYLYQRLTPEFNGKIADLGCGSGAIILGLCSMMPKSSGDGFDNSHQALTLAKENLVLCKLENRVCFKNFDWLKNKKLQEKYDLVVSNPPYLSIEEWSECEPEVKIYDPRGSSGV